MENDPMSLNKAVNEELPNSAEAGIIYPPKFQKPEQTTNIWLRSFASLALYLILGYYIFPSYKMLLLITAIVMFHELGHFFAMKYFRYSDLGIFFIPLLGAYVSGTKREVSQKQSAIILLAGPLPGIVIGIILFLIDKNSTGLYLFDFSFSRIAFWMILLNLVNLFPVYPLDGGQLLNRVFLDEESIIAKIFVFLSAGLLCWFALVVIKPPVGLAFLIFPVMILLRSFTDSKINAVEKKIEMEGINIDHAYEDLPDEDYWRVRNILINEHPSFKDIPPSPPYEYSIREDKVMSTIQSLLHRHLIQDVSIAGKIFILLIWIAAISSPWLLNMDLTFGHAR